MFSVPPIRAGILGFLTLGLLPLFRMRKQFRDVIRFERQEMWYFSEFLRARGQSAQAQAIAESSHRLRYRGALDFLGNLCIVAIILVFAKCMDGRYNIDRLLDRTFLFVGRPAYVNAPTILLPYIAWNVGLAIAYLLHFAQVQLHARGLKRALASMRPAGPPQDEGDYRWPIVAVLLGAMGGIWAFFMAVAGGTQRRYVNVISAGSRAAMLQRVHEVSDNHHPAAATILSYRVHGPRCQNPLCRAMLPSDARFCPRCGTDGRGR
jgi:hypothetical protein